LRIRAMNRQIGITLVEVLVAILVLAIGLLGIAGLQTAAMGTNFNSYQYTQAAILAQSMVERMRANPTGVTNGNYNLAAGTTPTVGTACNTSTACTTANQAAWDLGLWYSEVTGTSVGSVVPVLLNSQANSSGGPVAVSALPSGAVSISCPSTFPAYGGTCLISVYWDPTRSGATKYDCTTGTGELSCLRLAYAPP